MWCWRNQTVLGDEDWDALRVASRVVHSAYDFAQFLNPRKITDASGLLHIRWKRPQLGVIKLNVDVSCIPTTNVMCTVGLLRSDMGDWISRFSTKEGTSDPLLAELLAVKNGLIHAWDEGARGCFVNMMLQRSYHF